MKLPRSTSRKPVPLRAKAQGKSKRRRRRSAQLCLAARSRGGYRAGAGRPRGRSDHYVPHVVRPRVTRHHGTHVTLSCVPGLPSLRRPVPARLIEEIFAAEGKRKGFRLVHYAIRRNHLHLVCEADNTQALSRGLQRIASRIARRLNQHFGRRGRFFADRFHCVVITTPRQMRNVLRYVYLNAHKDRAKRGKTLKGVDPYSSQHWFDGWAHLGRKARPPPPPLQPAARDPVTAPRSWLLSKGWRRHGLIRTDEKAPVVVAPAGR